MSTPPGDPNTPVQQPPAIEVSQLPADFLEELNRMRTQIQTLEASNAALQASLRISQATSSGSSATPASISQPAAPMRQATPGGTITTITDPVAQAVLIAVREMTDATKAIAQASASRAPRPQLVDVKGIGKPPVFAGDDTKFSAWSTRMKNFICAVFNDLTPVLEWAMEQDHEITTTMVNDNFGTDADAIDQIDDLPSKLHQVGMLLIQMTEHEPFDIVRNCGESFVSGLEAWRKLHRRFDPSTVGRKTALLQAYPHKCKTAHELPSTLEKWEELIRRFERRRDMHGKETQITEEIKMGILETMVPAEMQRHINLNRSKIATYEQLRNEIVVYYEGILGAANPIASERHRNDPMDINTMKGKGKGKDKGNGKGSGSGYEHCLYCGKKGHWASECRKKKADLASSAYQAGKSNSSSGQNLQSKGKGDGKNKNHNKSKGKGRGKGKGKGKSKNRHEGEEGSTPVPESQEWTDQTWEDEYWEEEEWDESEWPVNDATSQPVSSLQILSLTTQATTTPSSTNTRPTESAYFVPQPVSCSTTGSGYFGPQPAPSSQNLQETRTPLAVQQCEILTCTAAETGTIGQRPHQDANLQELKRGEHNEWLCFDSGCSTTTCPRDWCKGLGRNSKPRADDDRTFGSACGSMMYPEGYRWLRAKFTSNNRITSNFKPVVTECRKPLLSAFEVNKYGNNFTYMDEDGGFICRKNGQAADLISNAIQEAKQTYPDEFSALKVFNQCYYTHMSFRNPHSVNAFQGGSATAATRSKSAPTRFPHRHVNTQ